MKRGGANPPNVSDSGRYRPHTLDPMEPGTVLAVGVSGSGKSHGNQRDAFAAIRRGMQVVVVDSMHEWTALPPDIDKRLWRSARGEGSIDAGQTPVAELHAQITSALLDPGRAGLLIIRAEEGDEQVVRATEAACRWAIADRAGTRERTAPVRGVLVPEVWQVAPTSNKLSPALAKCIRAWRHRRVKLWLDAQRISNVARNVTELAREIRCYAMTGDRDFEVVIELGGPDIEKPIREAARLYAQGEKGYHVALQIDQRCGPYTLRRSPA